MSQVSNLSYSYLLSPPPPAVAWNQELDRLSCSWRNSGKFADSQPADAEASSYLNETLRETIHAFSRLLAQSDSPELGYATIYARILATLPEDSFARQTLNDSLTISVAMLFLQNDAEEILFNFNEWAAASLVRPIVEAGDVIMRAISASPHLTRDEFTTHVIAPALQLASQAEQYSKSVIKTAQNEARAFANLSARIVQRTTSFVVSDVPHQVATMISDAIDGARHKLGRQIMELAEEHRGFINDSARMITDIVFAPEEAMWGAKEAVGE
jgi:hypothetical protein